MAKRDDPRELTERARALLQKADRSAAWAESWWLHGQGEVRTSAVELADAIADAEKALDLLRRAERAEQDDDGGPMTPPSKDQVREIRERWQRAYDVPGLRHTPVAQRDVDLGELLTAHERALADLARLTSLLEEARQHIGHRDFCPHWRLQSEEPCDCGFSDLVLRIYRAPKEHP